MVELENVLRELTATKELVKRLNKDLSKLLENPNFAELKKELRELKGEITRLNENLSKWVEPSQNGEVLKQFRKELELTLRLLEELQREVEFINRNLYLKPWTYTLFAFLSFFLLGLIVGFLLFKSIF